MNAYFALVFCQLESKEKPDNQAFKQEAQAS